jgi:hypothetical protein
MVQGDLEGSKEFLKGPRDHGRVRGVLNGTKVFWKDMRVLKQSGSWKGPRSPKGPRGPVRIQWVLKGFEVFWKGLMVLEGSNGS